MAGNDLTEEYFPTVYKAWVQHPAPALPEKKKKTIHSRALNNTV